MSEGPRQQRANAWAWVYLALFRNDWEPMEEKQASAGVDER